MAGNYKHNYGYGPDYEYAPGYCPKQKPKDYNNPHHNVSNVGSKVQPIVRYGLMEAREYGVTHAMDEVARIAYLMGMGYDMETAHRYVEQMEQNEMFPD